MRSALVLLGLGLVAAAVYGPGVDIRPYNDDYQFVFDSPQESPLSYLTRRNPQNAYAYRPIEAAFLASVQRGFEGSTVPTHVVQIALHALLAWWVFQFMEQRSFTFLESATGAGVMLVSQANVHAVLSNDTLSQLAGTIFGCLAVLSVVSACEGRGATANVGHLHRSRYYLGLACFTLALLSKETSLAFLPMVGVVLAVARPDGRGSLQGWRRTARRLSPFLALVACYLALRSLAAVSGPSLGTSRYDFNFGLNVFRNYALFALASSVPVSSVTVFLAWMRDEILTLVSILVATVAVIAFVFAGLRRASHRPILGLAGLFAVLALAPVALLNHVSELYVYNAMPFVAVIAGAGIGGQLDRGMRTTRGRLAATALLALLASHILALEQKLDMMRGNGLEAERLVQSVARFVRNAPPGSRVLLVNPPVREPRYSEFIQPGFEVLRWGENRIRKEAGRPDVSIRIVEAAEAAGHAEGDAILLRWERATAERDRGGS